MDRAREPLINEGAQSGCWSWLRWCCEQAEDGIVEPPQPATPSPEPLGASLRASHARLFRRLRIAEAFEPQRTLSKQDLDILQKRWEKAMLKTLQKKTLLNR